MPQSQESNKPAVVLAAGASEDGHATFLVPAIGVGKAGGTEPCELSFDRGAAVFLLAIERVGDLLLGGSGRADLFEPEGFIASVERGRGSGELVGVYEDAAGCERPVIADSSIFRDR